MLDQDLLSSIATQLTNGDTVEVKGQSVPVFQTRQKRLKTVSFTMNRRKYQAIEQNPDKLSSWGHLARAGHKVVQFKDVQRNKFVAVAVDGKVREYKKWSRREPHRTDRS